MHIKDHLEKEKLHHAYLIAGTHNKIIPEIIDFLVKSNIETIGSPDFIEIHLDSIKIEDARNIKEQSTEKSFNNKKKIFIISANNFLIEAQNTLLKMFEEPIENTHFFVILPRADILLKTLASRFYIINSVNDLENDMQDAERFVSMQMKERISFLKDFLAKDEDEENIETVDSPRSRAVRLLNAIEKILHDKFIKKSSNLNSGFFEHIFKVREFLNMPGSSPKTLMESVALCVPVIK